MLISLYTTDLEFVDFPGYLDKKLFFNFDKFLAIIFQIVPLFPSLSCPFLYSHYAYVGILKCISHFSQTIFLTFIFLCFSDSIISTSLNLFSCSYVGSSLLLSPYSGFLFQLFYFTPPYFPFSALKKYFFYLFFHILY